MMVPIQNFTDGGLVGGLNSLDRVFNKYNSFRQLSKQSSVACSLLVAVPFYKRPDLVRKITQSLISCETELRDSHAEVVFLNDSPEDASLSSALAEAVPFLNQFVPCRLIINPVNLGFLRTCNIVFGEAVDRGLDLLLLNSDAFIAPGALTEMMEVSRLDPMIGFVNPRSNNATLATLPFQDRFRDLSMDASAAAWRQVTSHLPRMSYVPTAVGFCMLIRWGIMSEFGAFDEIYGDGYNEENDLVMRAGRRGYRAVLANHAFAWHEGQGSFALKPKLAEREIRNRAILLGRYPEYQAITEDYFGCPEQHAEYLLGALLVDDSGLLSIALDFSSFVPAHNGTSMAGSQLLASAADKWRHRFKLYVLCSQETYDFHNYGQYDVPRRDPHGEEIYAAIFRVGQPFDWGVMHRLVMKAATIGIFMLDTISLDSTQLCSPRLYNIWNFALNNADLVATTSELTTLQFNRRFSIGSASRLQSLHSLDLADYRLEGSGSLCDGEDGHFFVVGNHYWHKDVAVAVNALAKAYPERQVVVLGPTPDATLPVDSGIYAPKGLDRGRNILRLQAGSLTSSEMGDLYEKASVIIFPSHYEGFGMPLLNSLAAKKPVFVRPLAVFEEMEKILGGDPNIYLFQTIKGLVAALKDPPAWIENGASFGRSGDAARAADDVGDAIASMIEGVSYDRIVRRIRGVETLNDFGSLRSEEVFKEIEAAACGKMIAEMERVAAETVAATVPKTPRAFAARYVAQRMESLALGLFQIPGLLTIVRLSLRTVRYGLRICGGKPPE